MRITYSFINLFPKNISVYFLISIFVLNLCYFSENREIPLLRAQLREAQNLLQNQIPMQQIEESVRGQPQQGNVNPIPEEGTSPPDPPPDLPTDHRITRLRRELAEVSARLQIRRQIHSTTIQHLVNTQFVVCVKIFNLYNQSTLFASQLFLNH